MAVAVMFALLRLDLRPGGELRAAARAIILRHHFAPTTPSLEKSSGSPGPSSNTAVSAARSGRGLAVKVVPSLLLATAPSNPTAVTRPSDPSARSVIEAVTPLFSSLQVLPSSLLRQILPFRPATRTESSGSFSPAQKEPRLPVLIRVQVAPPSGDR